MLWVGRFGIVDGEAQEETPWVGAFPAGEEGEDTADLYLIVQPALPGSDEFCAELKEAIGSIFHKTRVTLTGGLLRAIQSAHEDLREWNRKSIKEHRVAAGVSCLALRGHEAYLAQVAPAAALLLRAGTVLTLEPRLPDSLEPLGLYDELRPDFTRLELGPGDRLLLLSPTLNELLQGEDLQAMLALSGEEALPALYRRARSLSDCAALLLAMNGAGEQLPAGEVGEVVES